jgi:hypothetical protein
MVEANMSDRTLILTFRRGFETWILSAVDVNADKCVITLMPILNEPPPTMIFWDRTPDGKTPNVTLSKGEDKKP